MIQVFGKKGCTDTRKAERFFKERGIKIQFVDMNKKGISKGELRPLLDKYELEELLDTEGKEYKKRNLQYMHYDIEELLEESPELYKTPIVRYKGKATLGYEPEVWLEWIKK